jgi:hypothetical protein
MSKQTTDKLYYALEISRWVEFAARQTQYSANRIKKLERVLSEMARSYIELSLEDRSEPSFYIEDTRVTLHFSESDRLCGEFARRVWPMGSKGEVDAVWDLTVMLPSSRRICEAANDLL